MIEIEVRRAIVKQFSARTAVGSRVMHIQSTTSGQTKPHSKIGLTSKNKVFSILNDSTLLILLHIIDISHYYLLYKVFC